MHKLFNPESIAVLGLSASPTNVAKLILENLIRWGYKGRIFGVHPTSAEEHVDGIKMYKDVSELPIVPDLAVAMIPARFIPAAIDACGRHGIRRMAVPSGGFNELSEQGARLAEEAVARAREHGVRFVGPNGVAVANTANGLCLPFVPAFRPPLGGMSIIAQSGGVGLMLWNFLTDENVGMAKFASIGNKLDLDEVDFLEYFGADPETKVIGMYLESIARGEALVEAASRIDKPIILLKSNTTTAGRRAAMSHTAALSNDDDVIDAALERANIIRIRELTEFISVAKAFQLPPMRGKRLMMMSPAGGVAVLLADQCERLGFEFADPGRAFYEGLQRYSNAGVIRFANPLDMGDLYDAKMYGHIFYEVLHSDQVDGVVYVSQWPHMPQGEDVFYRLFHTDLSKEATGTMLSSGKPLAVCLFGLSKTISTIKQRLHFPIFNRIDEVMFVMRQQCEYHARRAAPPLVVSLPAGVSLDGAQRWLADRRGDLGEESMELLACFGIPLPRTALARTADEAVAAARGLGDRYDVALKVVSPDALHKTDVGGVMLGLRDDDSVRRAFGAVQENLLRARPGARFEGVRLSPMAGPGTDMFVGARRDPSFGPVVTFGLGGVYVEVFRDVQHALCPTSRAEIRAKLERLACRPLLGGARGGPPLDASGYAEIIERVSHLAAAQPRIEELDLNPVRLPADGSPPQVLDARLRLGP